MKGVDRVEHVKSMKGARLALVTTLVRMGWVTLGATPWACCARYVRYTRKGFPPQTRPPSRSSRLRVAEADKCVKGRNCSSSSCCLGRVVETCCRYHLESRCGTGARAWRQLRPLGAGAPSDPPIRRRSPSSPFLFVPI